MERADFTIMTEPAQKAEIDALSALAAQWSAKAQEGQKQP